MMDPDLLKCADELRDLIAMDLPDLARQVDAKLAMVARKRDAASISLFLPLLNDKTASDEGMFSIIHACESFSDDIYVSRTLSVLPALLASAPRWSSIVFVRILNNSDTKMVLIHQLRTAGSEVRDAVRRLCLAINSRSPEFIAKTAAVLVATDLDVEPT